MLGDKQFWKEEAIDVTLIVALGREAYTDFGVEARFQSLKKFAALRDLTHLSESEVSTAALEMGFELDTHQGISGVIMNDHDPEDFKIKAGFKKVAEQKKREAQLIFRKQRAVCDAIAETITIDWACGHGIRSAATSR